jgi:hypothetical protein
MKIEKTIRSPVYNIELTEEEYLMILGTIAHTSPAQIESAVLYDGSTLCPVNRMLVNLVKRSDDHVTILMQRLYEELKKNV